MIHWNFVGSWVVRSAHFSCKNTRSSIMICKFFNTLIITSLCNKQFFRFGKTEKTLIPYGFSYSWRALQYREKNYVKREGYIPGYSYLWVNLAIEVRWIHLVAIWRKIVMFSPCFNVIYVLKLLQTSKFCDNWRREGGGGGNHMQFVSSGAIISCTPHTGGTNHVQMLAVYAIISCTRHMGGE